MAIYDEDEEMEDIDPHSVGFNQEPAVFVLDPVPETVDEPDERTPLIPRLMTGQTGRCHGLPAVRAFMAVAAVACVGGLSFVANSKIYRALTCGEYIQDNNANWKTVTAFTYMVPYLLLLGVIAIFLGCRRYRRRRQNQEQEDNAPVFRGSYEQIY